METECTTSLPILFISSYDDTTGVFTVPPGGDGWYYFFAYFRVFGDKYALFTIQLNGSYLCTMAEDDNGNVNIDNVDGGQGACATVVYAEEGKYEVFS